ncbi:2-ketoarginine methyltransferase [Streptacidiphilus pinicola]|uniref:2-ketoarginine methyltransferase n=1 Tax=Streptacidiphilus pinicola TaxID=2219663 RepID=A0A2X0IU16_9ACTN|nr:2-ketoarginine methyltransferase [Streptacidiphilus pinicola]RAG87123.1 2-ketoarginine methyltransferase [Streptacidiphilus pinicola]
MAILTDDLERRLIDNTQPVRFFFLAQALHHAMHVGLFEALKKEPGATAETLAEQLGLDAYRTGGLLRYLRNEGYAVFEDGGWTISGKALEVLPFAPWYEMMVGGYAPSMDQLGDILADGTRYATRNTTKVGEGSCGIGAHDALPLVEQILDPAAVNRPETIVDLGCGDGSFLMDLLVAQPDLRGLGLEPNEGSVVLGERRRAELGLEGRVDLVQGGAADALTLDLPENGRGICFMTAFVLQEVLQQEGEEFVENLLKQTFERYPEARWLVVEMDHQPLSPVMGSHGLAQTFYNPYFLIHHITEQRLQTRGWWEELFERLGLTVEASANPDPRADSTGLQFGVLLSKKA